MSRVATVYFIRHGQTDWNAQGRLQGHRDIDLNATGFEQAAAAAERLARVAGESLGGAEFVASPLTRARRTMETLRRHLDLPAEDYRVDARLMEIGFGSWEGSTWAEIRRRDPGGAQARDRDRWGFLPPGAGAESYAMLTHRVAEAAAGFGPTTVVVGHGGTARALLVALGLLDVWVAPRIGIRQGAVLVLDGKGWRWA